MDLVDIPSGKTGQLHPASASVNKPFKVHLGMGYGVNFCLQPSDANIKAHRGVSSSDAL